MPRTIKNALTYIVIILVTLALIEVGSFFALVAHSVATKGIPVGKAVDTWIAEHPSGSGAPPVTTGFDPLTQNGPVPGTRWTGLTVNQDGYVDNGHDDPLLNTYPEKPAGVTRVVMLGGSSAAGVTAKSNDETIAAQLEGLLNAGAATPGYQVLNFGAPGNYVFNEMTRYVSQVTHLDPDIVVFFDGYNDALYASFEHVRQALPAPIMNWADYSYIAFDSWNGIRSQLRSQPPAVFTYAFLLVQRLQEKYVVGDSLGGSADLRAQFYEDYYLYRLSQHLRESDPFYAGALEENLSFLAGYHVGRERLFLAYLQASPLAYRDLAPERAAGVDPLDAPVSAASDEKTNAVFLENMRGAFAAFAEVYGRLEARYAASTNIRFFDIRRLFENVDEHVYNDIIHTTARGNQIIAERMMADIRALETSAWNR